jgi:exodeoxyribonuclease VII large subunit
MTALALPCTVFALFGGAVPKDSGRNREGSSPQQELRFDAPRKQDGSGAQKTLRVSQLVRMASRQLESSFSAGVWVEGEISNLKRPGSGHLYFTLKDDRAQLAVVIFRSAVNRLVFAPRDGLRIRAFGQLSIYEAQGRFQLTAERAEPAGEGALQAEFERLKRKLAAEGLFDARHKKRMPRLPRWAVVITSPSGAAIRDILRVLERRVPLRVSIIPAAVQGPEAAVDIAYGLRRADGLGADVLVVTRGGGSLEDLQAFNSELVARAIHQVKTPVLSAVGHEIDTTISDLVADARAPTPSAAAEMLVPLLADVLSYLDNQEQRLMRAMSHQLQKRQLELERLQRRLGSPGRLLERNRQRLDELLAQGEMALRRRLARQRSRLSAIILRLESQRPSTRLARDRALLEQLEQRLRRRLEARLAAGRSQLASRSAALSALSPLAILSRGYSLVQTNEGRLVRDVAQVRVGDPLDVRLARGELLCRVEQVQADELDPDCRDE